LRKTHSLAWVKTGLALSLLCCVSACSITVDPEPPSAKAPSRWIESGDSGVISRRVAAMMWKGHVPSPGFDSYLLSEGARVFNERCTPCHGDTGNGDGDLAEWTMP